MVEKRRIIVRRSKIFVHCPFCGKYLLTLVYGEAERECKACNHHIVMINDENGFRLLLERRCAV